MPFASATFSRTNKPAKSDSPASPRARQSFSELMLTPLASAARVHVMPSSMHAHSLSIIAASSLNGRPLGFGVRLFGLDTSRA